VKLTKKTILGVIIFGLCFSSIISGSLLINSYQLTITEYKKLTDDLLQENERLLNTLNKELDKIEKYNKKLQKLINQNKETTTTLKKSALFLIRYNQQLDFQKAYQFIKYVYQYTNRDLEELKLIISMMIVESSVIEDAISSKGAIGLMQIMPTVWKIPKEQLLNPQINIFHGIRIINIYRDKYGLTNGLNAYNGSLGKFKYSTKVFKIMNHYNKFIKVSLTRLILLIPEDINLSEVTSE
tara:strand:+ start:251 stop:970 length:720 start_codon:yes stop_codon:yes gene_type:complete